MHNLIFSEKYRSPIPVLQSLVYRASQPTIASRSLILGLPVQ